MKKLTAFVEEIEGLDILQSRIGRVRNIHLRESLKRRVAERLDSLNSDLALRAVQKAEPSLEDLIESCILLDHDAFDELMFGLETRMSEWRERSRDNRDLKTW